MAAQEYTAFVDGHRVEIRRGADVIGVARWTGESIEAGPAILPGARDEQETRRIYGELAARVVAEETRALQEMPAAQDAEGIDTTLLDWMLRQSPAERLRMLEGRQGTELTRLLGVLSTRGVDFIVVGMTAAELQGVPVVTFDLDVLYAQAPENIERLLGAVEEIDAVFRGDLAGRRIRPNRSHLVVSGATQRLDTRFGPLDLLSVAAWPATGAFPEGVAAPEHADLVEHTVVLDVGGMPIRVLELSKLVELKRLVGRPKDLAHILEIEALLRHAKR